VRVGEGVFGLRRAFVLAGARTLIMTLWGVPDNPTTELMIDLYRRLLAGMPPADALRTAQLALRQRYPDPFFWGGFICQGANVPLFRFLPVFNPYEVSRPAQGKLFVGRSDVLRMIEENLAPAASKNILVLRGQKRTGKTSVLHHLRDTLAQENQAYLPVFVDMQGFGLVTSNRDFLYQLACFIREDLLQHHVELPEPDLEPFLQHPTVAFELKFLKELKRRVGGRRVLLMLDEFECLNELIVRKQVGEELLPYFRHLMQHTPLLFLVAGSCKLQELTEGPWSAFFNLAVFVDISTLKEKDARALITDPARSRYHVEEPAVAEVVRVAGCHPYFTQLVCMELCAIHNDTRKSVLTLPDVHEAAERALQSGVEQVSAPWKEPDCKAEERLILSVLASAGDSTRTTEQLAEDLKAAGSQAPADLAVAQLCARDVLRKDDKGRLRFTVPLLKIWLQRMHFDSLINAAHFNVEVERKARERSQGHA